MGGAKVVLLGEASHGTSEFSRMRARITRELIQRHGFNLVAVEADWPGANRIDRWVHHRTDPPPGWEAFARFPRWMWRNREVREFVDWLHDHNGRQGAPGSGVGLFGLDLYSLHTSIGAVLDYLDRNDPQAAAVARQRYGCLSFWEQNPQAYGLAALTGRYESCEDDVVAMLRDLQQRRIQQEAADGQRFMDAVQNARLVANAERYYRLMYYGSVASWNMRDQHMFDTLDLLLGLAQE